MGVKKHLLILALGATGTNAIVDQLLNNSHVYKYKKGEKEPLNLRLEEDVREGNITWKKQISNLVEKAQGKILIIHVQPQHFEELGVSMKEVVSYLKDDFDFIFMRRRNYLAQKSSHAFKHLWRDFGHGYKKRKAKINAPLLVSNFKYRERIEGDIKEAIKEHKHIILIYEKHVQKNPRTGADMIAKHFGFYENYKYKRVRNHYHAKKNKWSDVTLAKKIKNFNEVKKVLIKTKYKWMLWE